MGQHWPVSFAHCLADHGFVYVVFLICKGMVALFLQLGTPQCLVLGPRIFILCLAFF